MNLKRIFQIAAVVAVIPVPALAHHSVSMFDTTKTVTIEGTVTDVDWANPHSLVFLDGHPVDKPNEPVANWSVQLMAPAGLNAIGWQKDSIKVGDKIKVAGCPRKDNRPQILFIELSDSKGHHFLTNRSDYDKLPK